MRFSFITCTYNRAKYLGQTLRALCEQDFPAGNYEIVVVNNNSTDNTAEVYAEYSAKYSDRQLRYYKEEQQGFSFALNRGIKEAKGEFLVFADDDESVNTDHLKRLDAHLKQFPQAELGASPVIPVYETTPKWMSHFTQRLIGGYFNQGNDVKKLGFKNYPGTGHTIIKRELYQKFGYYNTELGRKGNSLIGAEDKDMFQRLHKNHVVCYYFPDIPIYHHIPQAKLTDDYFRRLTCSLGVSERIRTKAVSGKAYYKRLIDEGIKWGASLVLCAAYTLALTPAKGLKLLQFRYNVTRGLTGKI
ncbi:MAG: glycosyltransferase family 2 protein [Prevotella sp.]|jgi:glycosyltransferase involved in cell wall biosynthesis|nr:glycosyltransferase family 2 protein [Prevotella sp.]